MKLYEINQSIENVVQDLEQCLESIGEADFDQKTKFLAEQLTALELERKQKIENIAKYILNLEHFAAAVDAECSKLARKKTSTKAKIDWLKQYLTSQMDVGEKLALEAVSIGWRKSKAVEVLDDKLIPEEFVLYDRYVDKRKLKQELEAGVVISGASLVERNNIQIR